MHGVDGGTQIHATRRTGHDLVNTIKEPDPFLLFAMQTVAKRRHKARSQGQCECGHDLARLVGVVELVIVGALE